MVHLSSNDSLIVKCSHCNQFFSIEQFDSHKCELPINGAKEIPVIYFREDNHGINKTIVGRGLDGILYALIIKPRKPLPVALPIRRKETVWKSDVDEPVPETAF